MLRIGEAGGTGVVDGKGSGDTSDEAAEQVARDIARRIDHELIEDRVAMLRVVVSWLDRHPGIWAPLLVTVAVALRLAVVSGGDVTTFVGLLRASGTTEVLVHALLTLVRMVLAFSAMGAFAVLALPRIPLGFRVLPIVLTLPMAVSLLPWDQFAILVAFGGFLIVWVRWSWWDNKRTVVAAAKGQPPGRRYRLMRKLNQRTEFIALNVVTMLLVVLVIVLEPDPWMPSVRLEVAGTPDLVGYLVAEGPPRTVVLTDEERRLVLVNDDDIQDMQFCDLRGERPPLVGAFWERRYPLCVDENGEG